MDEQILGGEEEFEVVANNGPQTPDDLFFNSIVQALQEIVIDEVFQQNQAGFMRKNCHVFQNVQQNKKQYMPIFKEYQNCMGNCLEKLLAQRVNNFDMNRFISMLPQRTQQIDQQIYEILVSFSDFDVFKQLMLDYKASHQEQVRLKTIKSTKIPEHKKVQSANDNIFGNSKPPIFGNEGLVKKKSNQPTIRQKTQQQILVPDFVLTIRPLRKG